MIVYLFDSVPIVIVDRKINHFIVQAIMNMSHSQSSKMYNEQSLRPVNQA